jgi:endonuclease G
MTAIGKFPSLEAFLAAYEADRCKREREEEAGLSLAERMARRRRQRDVVEVDCKIAEVLPNDCNGVKHVQLQVVLTCVIESDADVKRDVRRHLESYEHVFVAIQYSDCQSGSSEPIPGLVEGADIRLRGRWITAKRAYPEHGEMLSVLHYTHAPIGFVIVDGTIYD